MLLLLATVGLFVLALVMLLNSDSELMAIPLIGATVLAGFGYMIFDAEAPTKLNSTPGAIQETQRQFSEELHKESLPDVSQSDYDLPIL
jgi:hypothetical protein